jgi:ParB family chromosome partitioning protein
LIHNIPIEQIVVPEGRRALREEVVEQRAQSIREIGLLQPIRVTKDLRLVFGRHRLEACKRLGWTEIPADVRDLDEVEAELAAIDENLERSELTALERSEALRRRKEIYEARHPETKPVNERGGPGRGHRKTDDTVSPVSFAEDAASKIRSSPRTVQREVQIAEGLTEEAKALIRGSPLEDSKTELIEIARLRPQEQKPVVEAIRDGKQGQRVLL